MNKHTPGPWTLVETPYEEIISILHVKVGEHQIPVHPYKRIWSEDRTQSGLVTDHQHKADARLIAAAPDLLEALKKIRNAFLGNSVEVQADALKQARAAIAKATEEQA